MNETSTLHKKISSFADKHKFSRAVPYNKWFFLSISEGKFFIMGKSFFPMIGGRAIFEGKFDLLILQQAIEHAIKSQPALWQKILPFFPVKKRVVTNDHFQMEIIDDNYNEANIKKRYEKDWKKPEGYFEYNLINRNLTTEQRDQYFKNLSEILISLHEDPQFSSEPSDPPLLHQ